MRGSVRYWIVVLASLSIAVAVSTCNDNGGGADVTGPAPDQPVLAFDDEAASRANGGYPPANPETVCGSATEGFLSDLTPGSLLRPRVPFRLADIKPSPSQVMVSGAATNITLVNADFPRTTP